MDGHVPSHRALQLMRREDRQWYRVHVRTCKYLNNIVEQDQRVIKRRYAPMMGLKAFHLASVTIAGIELANHIRKRQFALGHARGAYRFNVRTAWEGALFGGSVRVGEVNQNSPRTNFSIVATEPGDRNDGTKTGTGE